MALTRVVVGRLGRPHGIRGEVTVEVRTDEPELRFAPGSSLFVEDNRRKPLTVETMRWHSNVLLIGFKGFADRNRAEELRGLVLEAEVDESELPTGEDEYYDRQLVGLVVELASTPGQALGEVSEVLHLPSQDVFVIVLDEDDREVLLPFVSEFVSDVDLAAGCIRVTPPAGLFDENFEVAGDATTN